MNRFALEIEFSDYLAVRRAASLACRITTASRNTPRITDCQYAESEIQPRPFSKFRMLNMTLAILPQLFKRGIVDHGIQQEVVERYIRALGIKCVSPDQKIRELSGGNDSARASFRLRAIGM